MRKKIVIPRNNTPHPVHQQLSVPVIHKMPNEETDLLQLTDYTILLYSLYLIEKDIRKSIKAHSSCPQRQLDTHPFLKFEWVR